MGKRRDNNPLQVEGVDNPQQRRVYNEKPLFSLEGEKLPAREPIDLLTDEQLEQEAVVTEDDILLAFAELEENPFLQGLFNADVIAS